jgi:bifunctional DNA-binding transcriptional regulator/antitoxin component of YhaV-PrlF toxin-antitoxin module
MSTLTITAKGQVTFGKDLLNHLGVKPGETVTVSKLPGGAIEMRPAQPKGKISDVFNSLKRKGAPRLSLKQIKRLTEEGWAGKR